MRARSSPSRIFASSDASIATLASPDRKGGGEAEDSAFQLLVRAEVVEMRRPRHDERYWRERVEKWATSSLSADADEFASREGIRPERLFFWKRRLRASSAIAVAGVSFAKISCKRRPPRWP
jgi:hypothetical protein